MQSLGPSGCRRRALDGSLNPPSPGSNKCRCPARLPGRERSGSGSGGTMEILSIQQLVSDEQPEGKVGCFAARARGAAWEPERWRSGPAGAWWESVEREKQKAEDEKKKKLEALNNSRLKLDSLQDLEAFVKLHKQKKKRKKVALPKQQEPEIIIESVESEQFLDAALENQIPVIDKYLADGGDPNAHDKFKCTALHRACLRGHAEIVDKLLEAGAKLEPRDMLEATPLFWACRGGHLDILKGLISRGAKISTRDKVSGGKVGSPFLFLNEPWRDSWWTSCSDCSYGAPPCTWLSGQATLTAPNISLPVEQTSMPKIRCRKGEGGKDAWCQEHLLPRATKGQQVPNFGHVHPNLHYGAILLIILSGERH
ncbi:ankyrin repeat domain-containing protein 23 isoform X1 [Python bivittatus]|uniref:Ankyrin repeat domain-containing protein 23 isoform X1 n=1 Tax=Python bivittatus TaxID=176946 RepID=A0A9F5IFZ0_PYTBI|nr:ankyrin repeat domain-containing protein 23 isoform X1 [Python bivittatus]